MKSSLFVVHISGLNLTNIKYVNCFEPFFFFNVNKNIRSQKIANNHLHALLLLLLLLLSLCIFINTIEFSSPKKKKDRILTYAFISSS